MKHYKTIGIALLMTVASGCAGCDKVPAGNVGIKVNLYGDDKGRLEVVGPGRHWVGMNEDIFIFPVYEQNPKYTKGSEQDAGREVEFQSAEGMAVDADFSVTYTISSENAPKVFAKYRREIEEINREPLRNILRDAVGKVARTMPVESLYGEGATRLVEAAEEIVKAETASVGISVTRLSLLGPVRLPANVTAALNSKIEATQRAQQRENELREAKAEAEKKVAIAEGEAQAELARARATSEANKVLSASLTPALVEWERVKKWDGKLPTVHATGGSGGGSTLLSLDVK